MKRLNLAMPATCAPLILDDAEIEHQAALYAQARVIKLGVSFENYLLLRGPQARMERDLDAAGCEVHDGQWIEKMRHRVWPRKAPAQSGQVATRRRA